MREGESRGTEGGRKRGNSWGGEEGMFKLASLGVKCFGACDFPALTQVLFLCVASSSPTEHSNLHYVLHIEWCALTQCFYGQGRED